MWGIPFWIFAVVLAIWAERRNWRPLFRITYVAVATLVVAANFPSLASTVMGLERTVVTAGGHVVQAALGAIR